MRHRRRPPERPPTWWVDLLDDHLRPRLPASVVVLLRRGRARDFFNWLAHNGSNLVWAAFVLAVLVILGVRLPDATGSFGLALRNLDPTRAIWLVVAVGVTALSFVAYGLAQRRLLMAGGKRLRIRTVTVLVFASTGLTGLLPGGVVPASGWLLEQYRRRGIDESLGLWAIIAGGFVSAVSSLSLLLISCGLAGVGPRTLLVLCGLIVVVGARSLSGGRTAWRSWTSPSPVTATAGRRSGSSTGSPFAEPTSPAGASECRAVSRSSSIPF